MKKITLLVTLMITSLGFSQNLITNGDFEAGITGWSGNAANLVTESGNSYSSANVAVAGAAYTVNLSYVLPLITQGKDYKLTFDAWSDTNRTLIAGIGLNQDPWTADVQTVNLGMTSKTYVLTLTAKFASPTCRVIFDMGAATGFVGIDNVKLEETVSTCNNGVKDGDETGIDCGGSCTICVPAPTVAATPPPARPAADVKSIFSNVYTPITAFNYAGADGQPSNDNSYDTSWSSANTALVQVEGNDINKITGLGFQGISFLGGRFDASTFTHFHIDIWVPTATLDKSFNLKLVNFNGGAGEANAVEKSITNASTPPLPSVNPGSWISLDIPLDSFTIAGGGSLKRNDVAQFVITSDLGTVYYDNLYFHKNTTLGNSKFEKSNVKLYPNPVKNRLNIEANGSINKVSVYNLLGQEVLKASPKSGSTTLQTSQLQKGVYVVKTDIDGIITTSKIVKE